MAQAAIIDKCSLCETEEEVNYYCISCQEILCTNCKLFHSKNRKTKNDEVVTLSQARQDDLVRNATLVYCSEHSAIELTLLCIECDKLICTRCLIKTHYGHEIAELDDIKDSKTKELNELIITLQEKKATYDDVFLSESQEHSQFLQSIEQAEKGISDQKAKITEDLNTVCVEKFSKLSKMRQNEQKRYSDVNQEYQAKSQTLESTILTARNSAATNNTALIIKNITDTTKILHGLKESAMPQMTIVATFKPGHLNISHILGEIKTEQKTKATSPTPQVQKNEDKTKLGSKLHNQKVSGGNRQRPNINKPRTDVNKVRIKTTLQIKNKDAIFVIVPLANKTAWVKCDTDHHMTLIDTTGRILAKSVALDNGINDAKEYRNGLLVTCYSRCQVIKMSANGKITSTFSDLSPYITRALCITRILEVMVCLQSSKDNKDNKIVRLNKEGDIIQTIQHHVTGAPLYKNLFKVTSLLTGEIIALDGHHTIVGVDRVGQHLFTWEGEVEGMKLSNYNVQCVTHDKNNNLFVTDWECNRVYVLGKDGSGAECLLDSKQGLYSPWAVAVDKQGQLWVGCYGGNIHIIEY